MAKQSTDHPGQSLVEDSVVESWTQEKVSSWLKEKGWGQFASTFEG